MTQQPVDLDTQRALHTAAELRVLLTKLKRVLREQATLGDYTPSQLRVLHLLEQSGPATVTVLAQAEGVRPQSMGETVAVLKRYGLIKGAPDPADGRQTVLSLTPAFRSAVKSGRAAREDWLFRAIRRLYTPAEQRELAAAVELLKRLVA